MGASDLPLGIRQRIERRWSERLKRAQAERGRRTRTENARLEGNETGDASDDAANVDWRKPRDD